MSPTPESLKREQAALASTRASVWQHVLLKYGILDKPMWDKVYKAYNDRGAKIQIETILFNNGIADEKTINQLRSASKVQLIKTMLVQSKVISKEQWAQCEQLQKQAGNIPIDKVLVQQGFVTEQQATDIKARLRLILGRWPEEGKTPSGEPIAAAPPSGATPPPPPTQVPSAPSAAPPGGTISMDDIEDDEPAPSPPSSPPSAALDPGPQDTGGSAIAMDFEDDDEDGYGLADGGDDEGGGSRTKRVGEMEWTNTTTDNANTSMGGESDSNVLSLDRDEDDLDAIDLDESEPTEKIIVNESISLGAGPGKAEGPKLIGAKPMSGSPPPAAAAPADDDEPDAPRIESPVAPLDMDPDAHTLLQHAVQAGASDLHLSAGSKPFMRLNGELQFFDADVLTTEKARRMALGFMDDAQQQQFLRHHDLDFSYDGGAELGRCRVNALEQFRGPSIIFRIIPAQVPTLEYLGIPKDLGKLTEWTQGLVLVTGPAGCGKSTTAAALVDLVNTNRKDHIITVEDPVEYIHPSKNCNVTQRQVPIHTKSFAAALKAALREDPDVIMIGEMRDLETISLAMTAAETGHLVIGTLHTKSAARTIDRIVDVFPSDQQAQVRTMLSEALRGIITQQLVRKQDGSGRVAALEVLYVNTAVANLIRDSKTFQLASVMQTGRKQGQRLMDESLTGLAKSGVITKEEAMKAAENPNKLF